MEVQTITLVLILKLLLIASVFLIVFALALRATRSDALFIFTHPRAAFRAVLALYLIVPVVAVVLAMAFDLKPVVKVAIVAIALSPMPPVLTGKELKAGGKFSYVTGLLFGMAMMSIVAAPLGLWIVDQLTPRDLILSPGMIVSPIILSTALPLLLGMIGRKLLGDAWAGRIAGPVSKVATIMLVVGAVIPIVALAPAMWELVGDGTIIALSAMIFAGIAAGYWLAEGDRGDKAALALAASARHPGVAIAIAIANFPDARMATAAILLGTLLSAIISIPFLKYIAAAGRSAEP